MITTEYRPRGRVDLALTVGVRARGPADPTVHIQSGRLWLALRTAEGIATLTLRQDASGTVHGTAWGPGAEQAREQVPRACGADDSLDGFDASRHPLIQKLHDRDPGLRLGQSGDLFSALAGAILEQKVTGTQAFRAWRDLVRTFGTPAPGPTPVPMFVPPAPADWARIPSWAWHHAGVEPPQSRALVAAASRASSLTRACESTDRLESRADAGIAHRRILTSLPGIGSWTAAETCIRACGDPDAVSVGDYHLAHEVGYALTGQRTDDDGMLELLRPWAGHRQRVIRLIRLSPAREARHGPRMQIEDHRNR